MSGDGATVRGLRQGFALGEVGPSSARSVEPARVKLKAQGLRPWIDRVGLFMT